MYQIVNQLASLGNVIAIVWLFTCGLRYIQVKTKKEKGSFKFKKVIYAAVGLISILNLFYTSNPEPMNTLINCCLFIILLLKIATIAKFGVRGVVNRVKTLKIK